MMFPRIYSDEPCPLGDEYKGFIFRLLLNPTSTEIDDWQLGGLGVDGCAECETLGTGRGKQGSASTKYCKRCQTMRDRLGRAAVAIYGTSHVEGFDFSTPESSLATFSMPDLPSELLLWLYTLPDARWIARSEDVKKKLQSSSATGNSTPD